jgi:two-component system, OmpR family, phosphate regulon sensor histidine kinase PhoR
MGKKYFLEKNISLREVAYVDAIFVCVFFIAILSLCFFVFEFSIGISFLITFLTGIIFDYIFTYYLINKFVYRKIRLIYKVIHDFKVDKQTKKSRVKPFDNRLIEKAERDVVEFMEKKTGEIDELRKMETYRSEFLGNVSHELKTPLTAIQGYILTLLDGGLSDEKINCDYLKRTANNIDRIIAIVNDLDTITRLESKELALHMEKFDLYVLVKETLDLLEMKAETYHINLVIDAKTDHSYMVSADRESIQQVLVNLIDNSIKYNGKAKGQTKISFFDMDENYLIEITDNGIGIDSVHISRLFERFYRVDKARSRETGGSGLGLAIVKHIIEAHGQSVSVRSTPNIGSTFGFTIKKA